MRPSAEGRPEEASFSSRLFFSRLCCGRGGGFGPVTVDAGLYGVPFVVVDDMAQLEDHHAGRLAQAEVDGALEIERRLVARDRAVERAGAVQKPLGPGDGVLDRLVVVGTEDARKVRPELEDLFQKPGYAAALCRPRGCGAKLDDHRRV